MTRNHNSAHRLGEARQRAIPTQPAAHTSPRSFSKIGFAALLVLCTQGFALAQASGTESSAQLATISTETSPALAAKLVSKTSTISANHVVLHNVAPQPNFLIACASGTNSHLCRTQELAAINNARKIEQLTALSVNLTRLGRLNAAEQLFVLTNLERTARRIAPVAAMTTQLNNEAALGARASADPHLSGWRLTGGKAATSWVGNWAGNLSSLGADYFWMYDDGVGYNVGCTATSTTECWSHRDNMLVAAQPTSACVGHGNKPELLMGASVEPTAYHGSASVGQLIVASCGGLPRDTTLTWTSAKRLLAISSVS